MAEHRASRVSDRETEYHQRRPRILSPERVDPFADKTPMPNQRTYRETMEEQILQKEEFNVLRNIKRKQEEAAQQALATAEADATSGT